MPVREKECTQVLYEGNSVSKVVRWTNFYSRVSLVDGKVHSSKQAFLEMKSPRRMSASCFIFMVPALLTTCYTPQDYGGTQLIE